MTEAEWLGLTGHARAERERVRRGHAMTEAEWLACADPIPMLIHLGKRTERSRKARFFSVACCRRIWHLLTDPRSREAVVASEQYADRLIRREKLTEVGKAAWQTVREMLSAQASLSQTQAADAAWRTTGLTYVRMGAESALEAAESCEEEAAAQAHLLRCLFGNPFRPLILDPAWRTLTVTTLAAAVYKEQQLPAGTLAPDRLAVLTDALEDAGCNNDDILSHLRGPGPHVRGCWVIDLLLRKE